MDRAASTPSLSERRAGLLAALAALHLILVCLFVWTDVSEGSSDRAHAALRTYKNLSGIFRDYRFFAPKVASDVRAGFIVERADGTSEFQPFLTDNPEVDFRYKSIVGSSVRDERLRDVMARSWAALMLGAHPEAARVTVVAQSFRLPAMREFAAGARPSWQVVYAGAFDRRGRPTSAAADPAAAVAPEAAR